jgi:hypothetical protein
MIGGGVRSGWVDWDATAKKPGKAADILTLPVWPFKKKSIPSLLLIRDVPNQAKRD